MFKKVKKNVETNVRITHQTYASCVASLTILIAGFWTVYISPVFLKFHKNQEELILTNEENAWIVAILDFGNFISPLPAAVITNTWGRKTTLILSVFLYMIAALCAIIATSREYLFVARFIAGLGKGLSFTVSPLYVAEISSKTIRGALSSVFYTFFYAGTIVAINLASYVNFQTSNYISLLLPILFLVLMLPLPESPYYYLMAGEEAKAERSLNWFRDISTKRQKKLTEDELGEIKLYLTYESKQDQSVNDLLMNRIHLKALVIVIIVGLAQSFGGISYMLSYGANDLPNNSEEYFVHFSVVSLVTSAISGLVVDNIGRKPILLISTITTSMCLFTGGVYFTVIHDPINQNYSWILYSTIIFIAISFTTGLGVIPATFQGELFPAQIKHHASAIVVMILSVSSFPIHLSHYCLTQYFGVAANYYLAAASNLFFAILSYAYVFEVKGKTLLEIQYHLSASVNSAQSIQSLQNLSNLKSYLPFKRNITQPPIRQVENSIPKANSKNMDNIQELPSSNKFYLSEFKSINLSDLQELHEETGQF